MSDSVIILVCGVGGGLAIGIVVNFVTDKVRMYLKERKYRKSH